MDLSRHLCCETSQGSKHALAVLCSRPGPIASELIQSCLAYDHMHQLQQLPCQSKGLGRFVARRWLALQQVFGKSRTQ